MFQLQISGQKPEEIVFLFEQSFEPEKDEELSLELTQETFALAWPKAKELFLGACRKLPELDAGIEKASANWSLRRISPIDLALIRLAYFEMLYREDIPNKASLNEAIEIAKNFGDQDSTSFINGVLDKLLADLERTAPSVDE
jgi:N utilization substance protein B